MRCRALPLLTIKVKVRDVEESPLYSRYDTCEHDNGDNGDTLHGLLRLLDPLSQHFFVRLSAFEPRSTPPNAFAQEYGWIAYIVLIVALYASRYFKKPSLPPTLVPISVPFKLSPGQSRGSLTHHILLEEDGDIVVRLGADPVADGGERGIARRGKELWRSNTGQGSACKKCSLTVGGDGTLWLKQGKKVLGKFSPGEVESLAKIVDVWV
ncbi:unnamed protein product [Discosporangium mesarthrocarpum]